MESVEAIRSVPMESIGDSGVRRSSSNPETRPKQQQSVLVPNWKLRRRLSEQEELIRRLRTEKDEQLRRISASLLLLESRLRRQKIYVDGILREKDRKISEQDACIRALLRLNRKLAASTQRKQQKTKPQEQHPQLQRNVETEKKRPKQRRTISWHSKVSIYGEDGRRYRASFRDANGRDDRFPNLREVSDEDETEDDVGGDSDSIRVENRDEEEEEEEDLAMAAEEACEAFGEALDGYTSDEASVRSSGGGSSIGRFSGLRQSHPDGPPPSFVPPPNKLGHVYNRVMSNHRSVTKPKDVKYKKISRVKSRSLEELRGQLKHSTQPILRPSSSFSTSTEEDCS